MMTVHLVTVGKLKEKYLVSACNEYIKRLGAYCNIIVDELPESRLPDDPSQKQIENALADEGKKMLKLIESRKSCYNIAMCIEGKMLSSEELAVKIKQVSINGLSFMNIFIGSSFGISEEVKKACDLRLSMSPMTFPHQLARVMLLEQLYRAFSINGNSKYHK